MSVYIAIPIVTPIALGGFYTYNGMSFYEYLKRKMHFAFNNRAYTFVSTEGKGEILAYQKEMAIKEKTEKKPKEGRKKHGTVL